MAKNKEETKLMNDEISADENLNKTFKEIGTKYQIFACVLLFIIKFLSSQTIINYMITANTLEYRCKVPECEFSEDNRDLPYNQPWLNIAIPSTDGKFDNCYRYAPKNETAIPGQCSADTFDTSTRIPCQEYVHATDERNMQTEFNIHCSDTYKLALVATVANIARFIFLPLSGLFYDKFGRLPCTVIAAGLAFTFGTIKTFSMNYPMYLVFEFFEAAAYGSSFTGIYVFAIELLNAKHRVFGNVLMAIGSSFGNLLFGIAAMYIHDFRWLMRIFNIPGIFVFTYLWLLPESIRWLVVTGRTERAIKTMKRIAKCNRREISEEFVETFRKKHAVTDPQHNKNSGNENAKTQSVLKSLWTVLKNRTMCLRFLNCSYQWIAMCFSYYGLYQYSTQIPGADRYVSFVIVISTEFPVNILVQILLNRMKRRILMSSAFSVAAVFIVITSLIPKEYPWIVVLCFLISKSLLCFGFTVLYMFTSEQFPTTLRTTLFNASSMVGRIGAIAAPFAVLYGSQYGSLPSLLFGGVALSAGILALFSPETFKKKLPDTIDDAINL